LVVRSTPRLLKIEWVVAEYVTDPLEVLVLSQWIAEAKHWKAVVAVGSQEGLKDVKGDGGDSEGRFQVQKKHWGIVPRSVSGQVKQCDKILDELLDASGGKVAGMLQSYNGSGIGATLYAKRASKVYKTL
jgi:hypothetical protein